MLFCTSKIPLGTLLFLVLGVPDSCLHHYLYLNEAHPDISWPICKNTKKHGTRLQKGHYLPSKLEGEGRVLPSSTDSAGSMCITAEG